MRARGSGWDWSRVFLAWVGLVMSVCSCGSGPSRNSTNGTPKCTAKIIKDNMTKTFVATFGSRNNFSGFTQSLMIMVLFFHYSSISIPF